MRLKGQPLGRCILVCLAGRFSAALMLVALSAGGCSGGSGVTLKSLPDAPNQTEKVFLGSFRFHQGGVEARDVDLRYGMAKLLHTESADFFFQLLDEKDAVLHGVRTQGSSGCHS